MKRIIPLVLSFVLAAGLSTVRAQEKTAVAGRSMLSALGPETSLVVHLSSGSSLVKKFKDSPLYALRNAPQFTKLFTDIEAKIEEARQKVRAESKVDFWEMLEAVQGEVLVVFGDVRPVIKALGEGAMNLDFSSITQEMLPFLIAVDSGSGLPKFKENLIALLSFAVKQGASVEAQDFQGGKLTVLKAPQKENWDGPTSFYVGEHGSRFAFGISRKFMEQTLAGFGGTGQGARLQSDQDFLVTQRMVGPASDVLVFVNFRPALQAVNEALSANPFFPVWQTIERVLVGKTLTNLGYGLSLDADGLRQKYFLHTAGGSDGIIGWFKSDAFSPTAPAVIPEDVASYGTASLNPEAITAAAKEFITLAQTFMGAAGGGGDVEAMAEQMIGVRPTDLVKSLGKRVHFYTSDIGGSSDNPLGDFTLILDLEQEGPYQKLFQALPQLSQGMVEAKKYMNRDLFTVKVPESPDTAGMSPALCVSDKMFLFSMKHTNVEKIIRRIGKDAPGLRDKDAFKKRVASLPPRVWALSFTSTDSLAKTFENLGKLFRESGGDEVPPEVFQLIAEAGKKFGDDVGYAVFTEQGYFGESYMPFRK
jgi:hypothetical protein